MGMIFKLIAGLTALATTGLLAFESARRGALVLGTIVGLIKILIFVIFGILMIVIVYLLLTPELPASEKADEEGHL